ncbi:MAG: hypothetical protein AAGJ18_08225 [Bacteroidota bacterium]
MIHLDDYTSQIENFIQDSITNFQQKYQMPNSVGIYCCPWSGWLTIHFNVKKVISETQNNCPDFEFVEFAYLDLEDWQQEYERSHPTFKIANTVIKYNHDLGVEPFNELIFGFLKPIINRLIKESNSTFLIQMLDSRYVEVIK